MTTSHPFLLRYLGPLGSRPRLIAAIGLGLAAGLLLAIVPSGLDVPTRATLAWDLGCVAFVWTTLSHIAGRDAPYIRGAAARQDEGQGMTLALVLTLSAASLAAVAVELSFAKGAHGIDKALRVAPWPSAAWLFHGSSRSSSSRCTTSTNIILRTTTASRRRSSRAV